MVPAVRRMLWMLLAALALAAALPPLVYLLRYAPAAPAERLLVAALLTSLTALIVLPAAVAMWLVASQRLEFDGAGVLHYGYGRRRIASTPLDACWTDGRHLLIDGHLVTLRGVVALFDPGQVRELLERLPASQWLRPGGLVLRWVRQMLRRRRATLAGLVVLLLSTVALLSVPREAWRALAKWVAAQAGL